VVCGETPEQDPIAGIWQVLRARPQCVVVCPTAALPLACRVAERLRVCKLVVLDPAGGLRERKSRRVLSFLDESTRDVLLSAGEAEFHGMKHRRGLLADIDRVLENGVGSVNLCAPSNLARELFTYDGAGTLFTRGDYCRVDRLGIDDFLEFERLVERGQKQGLLKPRSAEEIGELLLGGFGAWIGEDHLAGIGALWTVPYAALRAGEVTGLYTITRFKGERIGQRLVRRMIAEADSLGLEYVFAVTTSDRAAGFFRREGFRPVGQQDVPAVKWERYDPARRARARIFRRDLT
jgi:amino-acid N-acetyltransferase